MANKVQQDNTSAVQITAVGDQTQITAGVWALGLDVLWMDAVRMTLLATTMLPCHAPSTSLRTSDEVTFLLIKTNINHNYHRLTFVLHTFVVKH